MGITKSASGLFSRVETFFDELKLGYKWKYGRWDHLQIVTYRGYGTSERVHLKGRVMDDKAAAIGDRPQNLWKNISNTVRRIESDEIPGASVAIAFEGQRFEVETDHDGYFEVSFDLGGPLNSEAPWHEASLQLLKPESEEPVVAGGYVLIPPDDAEFAVVSDLDDTVIKTGATDKLRMVRTVMLNNANSRVPFAGVGALYRALEKGPDRKGHNPTFYVSSSPWNFYELFETFMDAHDIPVGPIFLKDFGFSEKKFVKTGHEGHKIDRIRRLLETYPRLPFILIGDSGQLDPEIYREIVREQPDRIRAVYVRDVTPPERDQEVHAIAEDVEKLGTPMVLVQDSVEAAEHAADHGLIHRDAVEEIRSEKENEKERGKPGFLEKLLGGSL